MKIPFFETTITGKNNKFLSALQNKPGLFRSRMLSEDVIHKLKKTFPDSQVFLTKSCTQALELAALLSGVEKGDEVIMPSFAFVACANAFALRGANCVFVDIDPLTMNIDPAAVSAAVTNRTKAVLTINYAGIRCDYEKIKLTIADKNILLVEDNAHGIAASFNGQPLGADGDISTMSFDYQKPITCGEGGAIFLNNGFLPDEFYSHYHLGTNKKKFEEGREPFYEWKSLGSNYYLSEILAAWLLEELNHQDDIVAHFRSHWQQYYDLLKPLQDKMVLQLPTVPEGHIANGYMFYIKAKDADERARLKAYLLSREIETVFHYIPLHTSEFGSRVGRFCGIDKNTTLESQRLLRLPLYYSLTEQQVETIANYIINFYMQ